MMKYLPAKWFLILYMPLLVLMSVLVAVFGRVDIQVFVNSHHSGIGDVLMKYWTWLGDGILLMIGIALLLLVSMRHFFTGLAAFAFGGLGAQLFKRLLFTNSPRPVKYFELNDIDYALRLIEGVKVHGWYSFPSGHTATAFAVFFAMAALTRNRALQAVCFCLAAGVGYSRIYLSQHFMTDVIGGSVLGIIMGYLAWRWIGTYRQEWLDEPLHHILHRKNPEYDSDDTK